MSKEFFNKLGPSIFIVVFAGLIVFGAVWAWTEPDVVPPGGNVYAPLNTANNSQIKKGNLAVNASSTWANGLIVFGNVGIDDTSPDSKLDVDGQIHATDDICTDSGGGVCLSSASTGGYWDVSGNDIYNNNSGNVGIGTTNPGDKLDVVGNIRAGTYYDRDDTAYYLNPAGTSRENRTNLNILDFSAGADARTAADGVLFRYSGQASMAFDDWFYMYDSNDGSLDIRFNIDNGYVYANAFYYTSDINFKKDIYPLENSLDKISALEGVGFKWKNNDESSLGFIAQDVEKIFPEAVSGEEGNKSIDYAKLIAPLVEAVKEQQAEIEDLKMQIEELMKQ